MVDIMSKEYQAAYRKANREKKSSLELYRRYGVTLEDHDRLLRKQNFCCAVCRTPSVSYSTRLAVDHCHDTGKIRGLLCSGCNIGIGMLADSPEMLRTAAKYIESSDCVAPC